MHTPISFGNSPRLQAEWCDEACCTKSHPPPSILKCGKVSAVPALTSLSGFFPHQNSLKENDPQSPTPLLYSVSSIYLQLQFCFLGLIQLDNPQRTTLETRRPKPIPVRDRMHVASTRAEEPRIGQISHYYRTQQRGYHCGFRGFARNWRNLQCLAACARTAMSYPHNHRCRKTSLQESDELKIPSSDLDLPSEGARTHPKLGDALRFEALTDGATELSRASR